jgi:hypothetical protein
VYRSVNIRAIFGKDWIQYCTYVRRQEGSLGCSKAHDSDLMAGCAGDVIGDIEAKRFGKVSAILGNRMGETKGGQRCREISAKLSMMLSLSGQRAAGKSEGAA